MVVSETKNYTILAWDTNLFGFPVARLHSDCVTMERLGKTVVDMKEEGVQLAYISIPWSEYWAKAVLDKAGACMVDRKVLFQKHIPDFVKAPAGVDIWPGHECSPELEALALASGQMSRFFLDPKIPDSVFNKLYVEWIHRSVRGEIADAVLVVKEAEELAGMVTLALDSDRGKIGLIAVANRYRGIGIGRRLMTAAEAFCFAQKSRILQVVTQGENRAACALYANCGFELAEEYAIYHLWIS
jgi:dTDP-4-amino-4,6-dideoxy-D-galactose acyltransferase